MTWKDNGHEISLEEGETYYIASWYPHTINGKQYLFPIIVECIGVEEWNSPFNLKELRNLIPSDYSADSIINPNDIQSDEWDDYFHSSLDSVYKMFYKEYRRYRKKFFNRIFGDIK